MKKPEEPKKPEVKKPEEKKSEQKKPEEKKPEEKKPEVKKPEEKKSEQKKPEEKKPEEKKPEPKKPESKKPEEPKKPAAEEPPAKKPAEESAAKKVEEKKATTTAAKKEVTKKTTTSTKEQQVQQTAITESAESRRESQASIPETGDLDKKKASLVPTISVDQDKSGSPGPQGKDDKRGSTGKAPFLKEPSQDGQRRGSGFIEPPQPGQRRGSFLLDGKEGTPEPGLLGAGLRKTSKGGSEATSRRGSTTEDDPAEKPSVPLKPCPGPAPKIFDFQVNQAATEGKTGVISFHVQGDPLPTFQFFKDDIEIFEGGRYKIVTDGSSNNLVNFCIRKSKVADEGKYKVIAKNQHGQDTAEISLFVGGEEGMDFRALLKKGKRPPPKPKDDNPDFGQLKSVESERKASIKEVKVCRLFFFILVTNFLCLMVSVLFRVKVKLRTLRSPLTNQFQSLFTKMF